MIDEIDGSPAGPGVEVQHATATGRATTPHVVHHLYADNGRGIASVVRAVAGQMAAMSCRVTIVASTATDTTPPPPGVSVLDLSDSASRSLTTVPRLRSVLRRLDPDVVFAHGNGPNRALVLATRALGGRPLLIGVEHNHYSSYEWTLPRVRRAANRALLPRLDAVMGVSDGVAEDLARTFPSLADKVGTLPAALTRLDDIPTLAAAPVDHPWFDDAVPVITTVGHVHPRKDHRTLVRAMARVVEVAGRDAARLVVVGSDAGPEATAVRGLVSELGLEGVVELVGAQDNPLAYVARSQVFAFSSRNEGLPIALMEALAVGTPVVSTDCPSGPSSILESGRYGILVPVGDAHALGDALVRLLHDDELRHRFASGGPARAAAFAPAAVARRYLEVADLSP